MVESGAYNANNEFQLFCMRFCFVNVLQRDLDQVKEYWNCHLIRGSGYATVSGRPDVLYYLPENYDKVNQQQNFDPLDLDEIRRRELCADYSFENEHEFL